MYKCASKHGYGDDEAWGRRILNFRGVLQTPCFLPRDDKVKPPEHVTEVLGVAVTWVLNGEEVLGPMTSCSSESTDHIHLNLF